MGSVIKMYVAGDAAQTASIDVPMAGNLVGVEWAAAHDADADADVYLAQLSFRSAYAFATNDDRGIISEIRSQNQLVTSGVGVNSINKYTPLPDIPIAAGERLYLHTNNTAGVTGTTAVLLHFDFDLDKVASRRR